MKFQMLWFLSFIVLSFLCLFTAARSHSKNHLIVSEEEITYGDAVRFCAFNSMRLARSEDAAAITRAVQKHMVAMPESGFWICFKNCNQKDFSPGILSKTGPSGVETTLHQQHRALCLDSRFRVRKRRHAHRHHHHHRSHHGGNPHDPFSNSHGIRSNPSPNLCAGYRQEKAQKKCWPLKQRHRIFRKCYRTGHMKTNFLIGFNQCVLDVCLTGQSQELANLITCDTAKNLVKKCKDEGVDIPGDWKPVFKCNLKPAKTVQTTLKPTPVCQMKPDAGPCRSAHTRLFFNPKTSTCEPFSYGGCGGNANNFPSFAECIAKCHDEIKIDRTNCPGNQISVEILQRLKDMRGILRSPKMNIKVMHSIPGIMKKVISEFKVFMNLLIHLQGQKSKDAKVLRVRMRQNLQAIFLLIESQINERLLFPKNKIIVSNEKVIVRTIDSVKMFLKGKKKSAKKPTISVTADERKVWGILKSVLANKGAKMGKEQMQAMKIFLPTLLIRSLGKMEEAGEKKQEAGLVSVVVDEKQKLNKIQIMMKKTRKPKTKVKTSETVTLLKKPQVAKLIEKKPEVKVKDD